MNIQEKLTIIYFALIPILLSSLIVIFPLLQLFVQVILLTTIDVYTEQLKTNTEKKKYSPTNKVTLGLASAECIVIISSVCSLSFLTFSSLSGGRNCMDISINTPIIIVARTSGIE